MSVMSGLGNKVSKKPKAAIAIILVLTILFTYFASTFQSAVDPEAFNPDHELINASTEAGELFGTSEYNLLVLARAEDGDLLEIDDMKAMIELEDTLRSDADVGSAIMPSQMNPTGFASPADILVMSFGLYQARLGMDDMLNGMDHNINENLSTIQDTSESNETRGDALYSLVDSLNKTLSAMQGGNGLSVPSFNKNSSLQVLDAISSNYGSDPIPTYLNSLKTYDVGGASLKISSLVSSINSSIGTLLQDISLLQGEDIDPEEGKGILMGLSFALPPMQAAAGSLDTNIVGMYFGVMSMMTKEFMESDGTTAEGATIVMNLNPDMDDDEKSKVEHRVHDITEEEAGELSYGVLGNQLMNEEIQETMDLSQMLLMVLVIFLIVIILFFTFRSGFDTALTIGSLLMAIIWSYGISVMIGMEGSIIVTIVPILLVGLGVDYGIHMIMRFREEKDKKRTNKKAITISVTTVGTALLLATVTTSIGFMSNTVSSLSVLRDFAIMVTIGIFSSFIIMTTFLPAVKLVFANRKDRKMKKKEKKKRSSERRHVSLVTIGAKAGDRAPWAVFIVLIIISSAAGYAASQLKTEFDFRDFLPKDTEAYENFVYLMDEFPFGDEENGNFYIKGDVTQPEVLLAINQTISRTYDDNQVHPEIFTWSILSVLNKYANPTSASDSNGSFIENWSASNTDSDGIPDRNIKTLFDILYNFETSHNEIISVLHYDEATESYDAAFVQLRVNSDNLRKAELLVAELEDDAQPLKDLEKDGTIEKVWILGEPVLNHVIITEMNDGQIRSIIITILASFIVLTIVFFALERSFILGLITIIPVGLVILWILGTMLLLGYDLNVMTITIASLTVGMGITYSIHISERFTEDLKHIEDVGKACENTLTHTGMALAGAFLTTSGGFGLLYFHKLPPLQQFGVLIALSIAYSFLASAYVLPTFLILWAKWNKKRGKGPKIVEYEKEHEDQDLEDESEPKEDSLGSEDKESPEDDLLDEEKESPEDESSDEEKTDKLPSEIPEKNEPEEVELKVKED